MCGLDKHGRQRNNVVNKHTSRTRTVVGEMGRRWAGARHRDGARPELLREHSGCCSTEHAASGQAQEEGQGWRTSSWWGVWPTAQLRAIRARGVLAC